MSWLCLKTKSVCVCVSVLACVHTCPFVRVVRRWHSGGPSVSQRCDGFLRLKCRMAAVKTTFLRSNVLSPVSLTFCQKHQVDLRREEHNFWERRRVRWREEQKGRQEKLNSNRMMSKRLPEHVMVLLLLWTIKSLLYLHFFFFF